MLSIRVLYPSGLIIAAFLSISALSGCGFKSDLSLPESEADTPLFVSDIQQVVDADVEAMVDPQVDPGTDASEGISLVLPTVSSQQAAPDAEEGVLVDITTIATDARILVTPNETNDEEATQGVPVDIDDLFRDVERERTE